VWLGLFGSLLPLLGFGILGVAVWRGSNNGQQLGWLSLSATSHSWVAHFGLATSGKPKLGAGDVLFRFKQIGLPFFQMFIRGRLAAKGNLTCPIRLAQPPPRFFCQSSQSWAH
jgi:hypothetical protein